MSKKEIIVKKTVLFTVFLSPFLYMLYGLQSAIDPIKFIYTCTGISAILMLILTLSISPLKRVKNFMRYRRFVGLFTFFYAFLHFLNFFILDAELNPLFVVKETIDKPFVYLGVISFVILLFMSITSTKKLFKKYNKWHKLVYIVLILVTIHASMAQKVLSRYEYFYIVMAVILIGYRLFLIKGISKVKLTSSLV